MQDRLPLKGVTVVELSTSVAAPFAGQALALLGADVIKVEKPDGGDDARNWGPPFVDGVSPVFNSLNCNKRSAAIDLKDEGQRAALRRFIIDRADVVLQNLRPGLVERYGLDERSLRKENPDLIYCNLSAFGSRGPDRMQPGYDPLMQACAGIMSVTGLEGSEPVRVGPSIVDQGTGMWAAMGILAALLRRERTGEGSTVGTSLYETAVGWVPVHISNYLATGNVPRRLGSENPGIVPYKAFEASDGWLVIAAGNDKHFALLARALGRPELAEDERFRTNPLRVENRAELNGLIQDIVKTDGRDNWAARLGEAGVPSAPVRGLDEVLEDPQLAALGLMQETPGGSTKHVGLPLEFDGERPPLRSGPPKLGDATAEILGQQAVQEMES